MSGDSVGGLIKFTYNGMTDRAIPVGLYNVSLNLTDTSNFGRFYKYAQRLPWLQEIDFIKNYQQDFSISREAWPGPHSVFSDKKFVDDYQKQVWEQMSKPFDELYQHYDTLNSLMDRFNEIYFNITTVKTFDQSKTLLLENMPVK